MDEQAWLAERFEENRAQRVCLDMLRSRKSRREESLGARTPPGRSSATRTGSTG
jgi:hypothetical protein